MDQKPSLTGKGATGDRQSEQSRQKQKYEKQKGLLIQKQKYELNAKSKRDSPDRGKMNKQSEDFGEKQGKKFCKRSRNDTRASSSGSISSSSSGSGSSSSSSSISSSENNIGTNTKGNYKKVGSLITHSNTRTETRKKSKQSITYVEQGENFCKRSRSDTQSRKSSVSSRGSISSSRSGSSSISSSSSSENNNGNQQLKFEIMEDTGDAGHMNEVEDFQVQYSDDVPYTQAINFDPEDFGTVKETSKEPIRRGDLIEYYSPIYVAGDARGLRQATVLAVDPKNEMPLVLSNGENIPNNTKLKRIKIMLETGDLVDHPGIFRPMHRFRLTKQGSATAADGIVIEASRFGRIMHKHISKLKEKAVADGFAPMDVIVNINGAKAQQSHPSLSLTGRSRKGERTKCPKIPSAAVTSCGKKPKSRPSLSDDSDNCSNKGYRMSSQKKNPHGKNTKNDHNKENKNSALVKKKRTSTGPLYSTSLFMSSDDSSIELMSLKHGRDHKTTQRQDDAIILHFPPIDGQTPTHSLDNSDDNESLLETPKCLKVRKNQLSQESFTITSLGRKLKHETVPTFKRLATSPSMNSDNSSTKQFLARRKVLASSSSSHDMSASSNPSNSLSKERTKEAAETNKSLLLPKCSSPSDFFSEKSPLQSAGLFSSDYCDDNHSKQNETYCSKNKMPLKPHDEFLGICSSPESIEIVEEDKSKLTTKKRSPPSAGCSLSDDINSSGFDSIQDETHRSKSEKQLLCEIPPEISRCSAIKNSSFSGWTKGKSGWKRRSGVEHGFVIARNK